MSSAIGARALEPTQAGPLVDEGALSLPEQPAARATWRLAWELAHDLSVAALVCFFLIAFVAQAFRVQGTSMQPLLSDEERIIVNKLVYRLHDIERGDVVVFWYPRDPSVSFIKRVVGLPGETIEVAKGKLYVNGHEVSEPYVDPAFREFDSTPPVTVAPGHYYVMGDHRSSSNDSRNWGEVPQRYIYGKAFFRFWPITRLGLID